VVVVAVVIVKQRWVRVEQSGVYVPGFGLNAVCVERKTTSGEDSLHALVWTPSTRRARRIVSSSTKKERRVYGVEGRLDTCLIGIG
jgi:hypothetical protein